MTNKSWIKDNERDSILDIAKKLTEKRNELDINQRDFADLVGTTQTSIRRLEGGETNVSAVLLIRAAKALDMDLDELLAPIKPEIQAGGRRLWGESGGNRKEYFSNGTDERGPGQLLYPTGPAAPDETLAPVTAGLVLGQHLLD